MAIFHLKPQYIETTSRFDAIIQPNHFFKGGFYCPVFKLQKLKAYHPRAGELPCRREFNAAVVTLETPLWIAFHLTSWIVHQKIRKYWKAFVVAWHFCKWCWTITGAAVYTLSTNQYRLLRFLPIAPAGSHCTATLACCARADGTTRTVLLSCNNLFHTFFLSAQISIFYQLVVPWIPVFSDLSYTKKHISVHQARVI